MISITIPSTEFWDEGNEEFISVLEQTIVLEHSLLSISKWETKWCKSFFDKEPMTQEEYISYIQCMTITKNVKPYVYLAITKEDMNRITEYINAPMTGIKFKKDKPKGGGGEKLTYELIYYYMITFNIPFECEKWHFNRLYNLIRVCDIKNQPSKKMSKKELYARNNALNAARKKRFNTKG